MDLADLNALLVVVEHGSFQGAARATRSSRNALRRRIDRLETDLGVELLFRGAKGITLTAPGREICEGAPLVLAGASRLAERGRAAGERARGVLRFIVPSGLPVAPRAGAMLALRGLYPDLDVELLEDEDPFSRIGDDFDLMFYFGDGKAPDGWYSSVMMRLPLKLRASPAYLKDHGVPGSVDDLGAHRLLYWPVPDSGRPQLPVRRKGRVDISPWVRSGNLSLLTSLAESGAGVLFAPSFPADFGGGGDLVPVLDEQVADKVTLRAVSSRSSRTDPRIRAMLKNARQLIESATRGSAGSKRVHHQLDER